MVGASSIHLKDSGLLSKHSIRVWLRGNSVVGTGKICMLKSEASVQPVPLHVRTVVRLLPVLQQLNPGWNCIRPYLYAMISSSPYHQDVSLISTATELMWYRTTLILKNDIWECIEDGVDITTLSEMYSFINDMEIDKVLTLGHSVKLEPKYLGFLEVSGDDADELELEHSASSSRPRQPAIPMPVIAEEHVVPAAPDEAELAEVDRPEPLSSHEVIVDGITLDSNTTLKVIRTACESLGLSKSGSKAKCLTRLHNFLSTQELVAQHAASTALKSETERAAVTLRVPEQPSEEERKSHLLTHQPYKQWCEYCVAGSGKVLGQVPGRFWGRFQEGSGAGSGKVPGQVPGRFRGRFRTTGFGKVPGQVPNERFREGSGSVFRTTGSRFREPRVPGRFRGRL